jgi:hypothetical protein
VHRHEEAWCDGLLARLPAETPAGLDALLKAPNADVTGGKDGRAPLLALRAGAGQASLQSVGEEAGQRKIHRGRLIRRTTRFCYVLQCSTATHSSCRHPDSARSPVPRQTAPLTATLPGRSGGNRRDEERLVRRKKRGVSSRLRRAEQGAGEGRAVIRLRIAASRRRREAVR